MKRKEMIGKVKQVLKNVLDLWYFKYVVVFVVGILFVVFLDENSVMSHLHNKQRINELKEEVKYYEDQNQQNKEKLRQLQEDPKSIEKIARERYFMKADDEDIFVLSEEGEEQQNMRKDETAQ